jgi:hypothetical protein
MGHRGREVCCIVEALHVGVEVAANTRACSAGLRRLAGTAATSPGAAAGVRPGVAREMPVRAAAARVVTCAATVGGVRDDQVAGRL